MSRSEFSPSPETVVKLRYFRVPISTSASKRTLLRTSPILLFIAFCLLQAPQTSFAEVAVGNCRPHLVSYSTISAAVADVEPGSTVLVCPGTYAEQVTIAQSLTLKGLTVGSSGLPVITVPSGGLVANFGQAIQLYVDGADSPLPGPVNISNIIVDGAGSGFDCANGMLTGIEYQDADGTLDNIEVRNHNPGGCGFGISLSSFFGDDINIRNSNIHDFDNTGIMGEAVAGNLVLNITSNRIASTSPSVQAGINYSFSAVGLATHNTITVGGQAGLVLENFYCCVTAKGNAIVGSNVGVYLGGSFTFATTTVTNNSLVNNGTGIFIFQSQGIDVVSMNAITQSSTAAIDLDCSPSTTAQHNTIFGAPVGIANISSGDTISRNNFYNVPTTTTACQ
jgi:hypothetical protein